MKIRAGGGDLGQEGETLGQQGAPPCYFSLWETLKLDECVVVFSSSKTMKKDVY